MIACKDCKYLGPPHFIMPFCMHPKLTITMPDYLNGETQTQQPTVSFARTMPDQCGPDATLFEPREVS